MGEVEEKAGAEAEKKGITGKARRDYIGGAFHRIMAHHEGKVKEQKEKRAEHKPPSAPTPAPAAKTKTQLEYEKFLASKEKSMEEARLYREDQDRLRARAKAREDAQEQSRQEDIARRKQLEALESQGYRPFGNWAIFRSGGGYEAISRDMNQHLTKDGKRVHFSTQRQLENYILKHGG